MERVGLEVTIASNGQEALELATTQEFDIIFMDCQMPVMDGFEATRLIRATLGQACPPVVAFTSNAMAQDKERCQKAGMDLFLAKPFQTSDLQQILSKIAEIALA